MRTLSAGDSTLSDNTSSDDLRLDPKLPERGTIARTFAILRNRVLSGFFLALPIFLTVMIISWVYNGLVAWVFAPIHQWVVKNWHPETAAEKEEFDTLQALFEYIVAPITTVAIVIAGLFLLGMFFRSRVHRGFDWIMLRVPFVRWVYSVVLKVVNTLNQQKSGRPEFKRVVLVEFPHPGMKAPAFVTGTCKDRKSGSTILCVYVPTTPVPTSGYMLMLPESDVIEISWDLPQTLEAIISGGVTAPDFVEYHR